MRAKEPGGWDRRASDAAYGGKRTSSPMAASSAKLK